MLDKHLLVHNELAGRYSLVDLRLTATRGERGGGRLLCKYLYFSTLNLTKSG